MATGALTPPPAAASIDQDDATMFGAEGEDLTLVPPTPDVTIAPPPPRAAESDATVVNSGRRPPADFDEGFTLAPRTRPPARTTTRRAAPKSGEEGPLGIGEPFGTRYHIIRLLGIGGMGAVYQAWDDELGVAVAIKVIRPEVMEDPTAAAEIERRFKRELLLARQVTHKNVVRIHDLGEIDGIKYITMPYVDGDDLATIRRRDGKMAVPRVLRIARSVIEGLVEAHKAGVVHRDLKPANIMIGPDDEAMIMDFGIARSTGAPTSAAVPGPDTIVRGLRNATGTNTRNTTGTSARNTTGTNVRNTSGTNLDSTTYGAVVGTVEYMAPEQAKGQAVDQRADVYAFGLILYDLLTGERRGKKGEHPITELQERMKQAPPAVKTLVPEVPEHVDQIVSRCLEPEADKRFATSQEVADALALLDDEGIPIPIPPRFSKKLIASAATLVIALVTATWYFTRTPPPEKPHDPVTVLIADFENRTGDPSFDHTLEPMLRLALEGAGFINANDRSRIRSTFGVPAPERLDETAARQLAMKQGVGVVLAGTIDSKGGGYEISIKGLQPISGNTTTTEVNRAANKDQVLASVTKLASGIRQVLGEKVKESDQLFAMRSISTTSFNVISEYAAGIELQSKGKYEDARQRFMKSVELDPKFGLGYQSLAVNSRNVGKLDDAEKYAKEALKYVDGMTDRERYSTRGNYYRITGDLKQCVKEFGELIDRYAADTVARNQRAICMVGLRDMRGAMEEATKAVEILPNHMTYRGNLALWANYAGDFAVAEKAVRAIQNPSARALQALPLSLLGQGRLEEAAEAYRQLVTMGAWGTSFSAAGLGDLALYEGRFADAVKIFNDGATADVATKNGDAAALKFAALANVHLARGQNAPAIAAANKALANSNAMKVRFLAGRILAEAGALPKAQALATDLAAELATEPHAYGKLLEGAIALKKRDLAEAVKILTEANGVVDTWIGHFDLGRAYLEGRAYAQADSEFDRCVKRRGEALSLVDEDPTYGYFPPVYVYMGRAREGLQSGFADTYREYLSIRGKSTDDPLLPDVRKRAGS